MTDSDRTPVSQLNDDPERRDEIILFPALSEAPLRTKGSRNWLSSEFSLQLTKVSLTHVTIHWECVTTFASTQFLTSQIQVHLIGLPSSVSSSCCHSCAHPLIPVDEVDHV